MIVPKPRAARSFSRPFDLRLPRAAGRARGASGLRILVIVMLLAALGAGGYYYYSRTTQPDSAAADAAGGAGAAKGGATPGKGRNLFGADRPTPVVAATVRNESLDVRLTALGTVIPRNSVVVRTRVDGPLLKVYFKEGQQVKAGELLAEIDPLPLQAALTQVAGQLARDQALLQNAQIDLQRYQDLMATDSIAKQQMDTQAATVRQYQGTVATDRGQVEAARLQLSYTRILAPLSGQVGLRLVDPGNIVKAGDANGLVTITQMDPITVVAAIPEGSVAALRSRMKEGSEVPVEAWDSGMKAMLAKGRLLSTDNSIDTTTGTLKLKAEFANPNGVLFPNQFVNVRVLIGQDSNAVVVRQSAIQRGAQGIYAYVIKDDSTVTVRVITLGTVDGERVAVTSGLAAGERVVVDGADKLREGAKVEVIDRNAAVGAPGAAPGPGAGKGDGKGRRNKSGAAPGAAAPGGAPTSGAAPGGVAPAAGAAPTEAGKADAAPGTQTQGDAPAPGAVPGARAPGDAPVPGANGERPRRRRPQGDGATPAAAPAPGG